MTAVVRFPARHAACIWLTREEGPAWLVLCHGHGWLHGDYDAALDDARWLGRNRGLAVRHVGASNHNCLESDQS
jgi:hypothetical protein